MLPWLCGVMLADASRGRVCVCSCVKWGHASWCDSEAHGPLSISKTALHSLLSGSHSQACSWHPLLWASGWSLSTVT